MTEIEKEEFGKIIDYVAQEYVDLEVKCEEYKTKLDIISKYLSFKSRKDFLEYDKDESIQIFLDDKVVWGVRNLVLLDLCQHEIKNEFYYQNLFRENIGKCIPNAKIIKRRNMPAHVPDAWVEIDGEQIPVEVKLNNFTRKALIQLQRYMNVYNTQRGIAVARDLAVELPQNILFIPFSAFVSAEVVA